MSFHLTKNGAIKKSKQLAEFYRTVFVEHMKTELFGAVKIGDDTYAVSVDGYFVMVFRYITLPDGSGRVCVERLIGIPTKNVADLILNYKYVNPEYIEVTSKHKYDTIGCWSVDVHFSPDKFCEELTKYYNDATPIANSVVRGCSNIDVQVEDIVCQFRTNTWRTGDINMCMELLDTQIESMSDFRYVNANDVKTRITRTLNKSATIDEFIDTFNAIRREMSEMIASIKIRFKETNESVGGATIVIDGNQRILTHCSFCPVITGGFITFRCPYTENMVSLRIIDANSIVVEDMYRSAGNKLQGCIIPIQHTEY